MYRQEGFTLIELLIVVAIIAILAAIAIPNFIEAQIRAKISRVKADMRTLAGALEAYRVDSPHYPPDGQFYKQERVPQMTQAEANQFLFLHVLTTPIAYITSVPNDAFVSRWLGASWSTNVLSKHFGYWGEQHTNFMNRQHKLDKIYGRSAIWSLTSTGPDQTNDHGARLRWGEQAVNDCNGFGRWGALYDATNGSKSRGDICRTGP